MAWQKQVSASRNPTVFVVFIIVTINHVLLVLIRIWQMLTDTGAKYHKANDTVRVILRDGSIKPLSAPNSAAELSEEGQEMCQYVSEVCDIQLL